MHWNFAVGTDLAHIVGKSVVAASDIAPSATLISEARLNYGDRHDGRRGSRRAVDPNVKRQGNVNFVVSIVSIVDLSEHL